MHGAAKWWLPKCFMHGRAHTLSCFMDSGLEVRLVPRSMDFQTILSPPVISQVRKLRLRGDVLSPEFTHQPNGRTGTETQVSNI